MIETKLWLKGHTFEEIRKLSLEQLGDILGFEQENHTADTALSERQKRLRKMINK